MHIFYISIFYRYLIKSYMEIITTNNNMMYFNTLLYSFMVNMITSN